MGQGREEVVLSKGLVSPRPKGNFGRKGGLITNLLKLLLQSHKVVKGNRNLVSRVTELQGRMFMLLLMKAS